MNLTVTFIVLKRLYKISLLVICSGIISAPSFYVYGQVKVKTKDTNKLTVSLKTNTGTLFSTNEKSVLGIARGNSVVFTKPLNQHLRTEAMISYNMILNRCCIDKIFGSKPGNASGVKLTLPVSMQYYPLRSKSKLQAFVGAGAQYNFNPEKGSSKITGDVLANKSSDAGTKYISLIFTQGVTYKINTKIEVFQSALFIPDANKTIGLNIGVGYTLP
ncbi:MAG: hypothetical protein K0Q79_1968 [Flavipsychrobacter sp.]|jgi:outer membrane protein W|nr:hypothetical protein [Flavipsychrobacter sp.]